MTWKQRNNINNASTTRMASKLELHPWKTGATIAIKALEAAPDTQSVCIIWDPPATDDVEQQQHLLSTNELISSLLEYIGNNMLDLESLSIEFNCKNRDNKNDDSSTDDTIAMATPPVSAITTLLSSSESIQSLSLIGLQVLNDDDLDLNGFYEAIRIHSTLHSLVVRNCIFAKEQHLEKLKHVTYHDRTTGHSYKRWKHLHISDNVVASGDFEQSAPSTPLLSWDSPFLSWCLYPISCCA